MHPLHPGRAEAGSSPPHGGRAAFTPGVVLRKKKFEQVSLSWRVPGPPLRRGGKVPAVRSDALQLYRAAALPPGSFCGCGRNWGWPIPFTAPTTPPRGRGCSRSARRFRPSSSFGYWGKSGRSWLGWPEESGRKNFCGPGPRSNPPLSWDWKAWPPGPTYVGRNELLEGRAVEETEVLAALDRLEPRDIERLAARLLQNAPWALAVAGKVEDREAYLPYIRP